MHNEARQIAKCMHYLGQRRYTDFVPGKHSTKLLNVLVIAEDVQSDHFKCRVERKTVSLIDEGCLHL